MTLSEADARQRLAQARERLAGTQEDIEAGRSDREDPAVLSSLAKRHDEIAQCLAVLGRGDDARRSFQNAAETYLEHVDAARERGDREYIRTLPVKLTGAIRCGLLAGDDELTARAGREALALANEQMTRFALGSQPRAKEVFRTLSPQLWGAVYLDESVGEETLDRYREAARSENERFLVPIADIFEGFLRDDDDLVREGIERRVELHEERFADGYDRFLDAIATDETARITLATRKGIDVSVDSEFLPSVLLSDDEPETDGGTDGGVPDPLEHVTIDWNEQTGAVRLIAQLEHDADRELSVTDLPDNEYGTIPTAEWYESVRATIRANPDAVGPAIREAIEDERVERKVIVHQPQSQHHLFDESFRDVDVGEIEFVRT